MQRLAELMKMEGSLATKMKLQVRKEKTALIRNQGGEISQRQNRILYSEA
jgi:hypothetical protein